MRLFPLLALAAALVLSVAPAQAAELWLAPLPSSSPPPLNRTADFMDLFAPDAPWKTVAARTKVFKFYGSFLTRSPQADIDRAVQDLQRRHIALGLEIGVMNVGGAQAPHPTCGGLGLVEGYGTPALAQLLVDRIRKAGGTLSYLVMDEPLWYGHYFKGRPGGQPGCQSSLADILALIQPTLAVYRQAFPGIIVGEVEPTDIAEQPNWTHDLTDWVDKYRAAEGRPLAFMQLDIPWPRPNEGRFAVQFYNACETLKASGDLGGVGVIYNAANANTDAAWVQQAEDHIRLIEGQDALKPDQAIIQSWDANPTHVLPETSSATLAGLAAFYLQARR